MANLLSNTTIGGYQSIHTGNIGSYAVTSITSGQVTTALGFTPYNATNPSGYISSITSGNVTTALGYTPYNATNPSGYITSSGSISGNATTATGIVTYITSKLNYSKQCLDTDTTSDGCKRGLTGQAANHSSNAHRARWILPNGVKVQASPSLVAWSATAMVWTVTAKAYAADMVTTGTNPDTIVFSCNPSDVSQTINSIARKAGTCGAYDASTYATPFNLVLNG